MSDSELNVRSSDDCGGLFPAADLLKHLTGKTFVLSPVYSNGGCNSK